MSVLTDLATYTLWGVRKHVLVALGIYALLTGAFRHAKLSVYMTPHEKIERGMIIIFGTAPAQG